MRDIIEKLKVIDDKHGYKAFLEHFKPSVGYYFKVNKNGDIFSYHSTGEKEDPFLLEEDYSFFKERLFFEGMLTSNKAIDASNKKIHSVTPYAMIFKYGIFKDPKLEEKGLSIKDVLTKHLEILNKLNNNSFEVNDFVDKYLILFDYVKESLQDICKKDDKILIFLDEEVSGFKLYYDKYLEEKLFITNDTITEIDGIKYGVPSFSITLNAKKPTLSTNPYGKYPYRVSFEEAMLLNYLNKLKLNTINDLLTDEENDLYKSDVVIELNANTKSRDIVNYNLNFDDKDYEKELNKVTIIQSEYINENPIIATSNRSELLDEMDWVFNISNNAYLFNKLFKIKNGDYKDFQIKCKTNNISSIFINNKEILKFYFKENGDVLIDKELSKILFLLYIELIKEDESVKRLRKTLDFMLTALDFVNKNGGYDKMSKNIKNIWDKLVEAKKEGELVIENNDEFFFVSGQLLYWLSTLNETANNTSVLLQDVLDIKCSLDVKNKAIDKYKQYAYKIPVHSLSFINVLYNAVISYEIDEEIKVKDFKYKYYYHAGLIGKNIKFVSTKAEDLEGDKIDEE